MSQHCETCPDCEAGQLRLETYSDEIEYREHTIRLDGLQCLVCENCGAEIFRPSHIRHNDRIFGGGANAFSKYERGEVIQSVPMDRLLRLVARYPVLLVELALKAGVRVQSIEDAGTYSVEQRLSLNDPDYRSARHARTIAELGSDEWSKTA